MLLIDPWLHPGIAGVAVPFAAAYRPLATGLGVIAFYLCLMFAGSFYVRRRIGPRRWRALHTGAAVAWALATVHAITSGSDAGTMVMRVAMAMTVAAVVAIVAVRVSAEPGGGAADQAGGRSPSSSSPT
jgi:DMSO/TMAO reductase YedYZ heme-binding membrane subunit